MLERWGSLPYSEARRRGRWPDTHSAAAAMITVAVVETLMNAPPRPANPAEVAEVQVGPTTTYSIQAPPA